jgi:hypothetical protein
MLFSEIPVIAVYSENRMKHINTLCGKNEELMIFKTIGTSAFTPGF